MRQRTLQDDATLLSPRKIPRIPGTTSHVNGEVRTKQSRAACINEESVSSPALSIDANRYAEFI